jgi:hypothetical protein
MVLGSGIRKKRVPDPGSRGQKAPNPGSRIRNTERYVSHILKSRQIHFGFRSYLRFEISDIL